MNIFLSGYFHYFFYFCCPSAYMDRNDCFGFFCYAICKFIRVHVKCFWAYVSQNWLCSCHLNSIGRSYKSYIRNNNLVSMPYAQCLKGQEHGRSSIVYRNGILASEKLA